jgi:hypothetical protein
MGKVRQVLINHVNFFFGVVVHGFGRAAHKLGTLAVHPQSAEAFPSNSRNVSHSL